MRVRGAAILSFMALAALASAQTLLGTKADVVGKPATGGATGPGLMPFLQMVVVLGVVLFLLKSLAPKIIAKLNKRLVTRADSSIRIEETASFAGGSLYIVQARHKTLLLSVGANGVTCVADLTENRPPEPEPFEQLIDASMAARGEDTTPPAVAVVEEAGEAHDPDAVLAALERLSRFTA